MQFDIITIFPEIFDSYFEESIIGRAQKEGIIRINSHNLRDYTSDKHKTVDDEPYGGGAGMLMKVEPIYKALTSLKNIRIQGHKTQTNSKSQIINHKTILLSAKGRRWDQQMAQKYAKLDNLIMVCGRYEGVDERVLNFVDEEISIGDYVLTGGEIGAMAILDSITRLLPGVLGNAESSAIESHSQKNILEYPQYTRPEIFKTGGKEYEVPKVLLSGNHNKIEKWKKEKSKRALKA